VGIDQMGIDLIGADSGYERTVAELLARIRDVVPGLTEQSEGGGGAIRAAEAAAASQAEERVGRLCHRGAQLAGRQGWVVGRTNGSVQVGAAVSDGVVQGCEPVRHLRAQKIPHRAVAEGNQTRFLVPAVVKGTEVVLNQHVACMQPRQGSVEIVALVTAVR